jgi:pyruvate dehydrogenase E1 component
MADQLARGFLIGATAGRTTLTGEGLQHADGHSPLLASTNPAVVTYDPAWAFEVGHIVRSGLERMYGSTNEHPDGENVIFYITVYNEPVVQPPQPDDLDHEGLLKGIYFSRRSSIADRDDAVHSHILASGVAMPWAVEAQQILADDFGVAAHIWSVTSWNELARNAIEAEKWNFNHPSESHRVPFVTQRLADAKGPFLGVSDYMRAVPDQISRWVPGPWHSLGADGFGFADTRAAARRFFQIDAHSIVVGTLQALAARGDVKPETVQEAYDRLKVGDPTAVAGVKQEGGDA